MKTDKVGGVRSWKRRQEGEERRGRDREELRYLEGGL